MQHLAEAIDKLPPLQRTLVTLFHLDEMPIAEIGKVTGLPEGTVKNYVSNILGKLNLRRRSEAAAFIARHEPSSGE